MGAPNHLLWQFQQARTRARLKAAARIERAGWIFAAGSTGFAMGVLCAQWFA